MRKNKTMKLLALAIAVVMLTATPLQTGDNDLFTLLNVLRPDVVIDKDTFVTMSKPNEYISRCYYYKG